MLTPRLQVYITRAVVVVVVLVVGLAEAFGTPVSAADTKDYRVTKFSKGISPGAGLYSITAGPDGNLWFTETAGNRIGRMTPEGKVTEFSVGITPGAYPYGITAGPDGNVWFTERGVDPNSIEFQFSDTPGRIGRITPRGKVTEFAAGLTVRIICYEYGCSTGASTPEDITAGPDGNLWFTEFAGDRIGRITPDGVVTEFEAGITQIPGGAPAHPKEITVGPDDALWFTEYDRDRIGRVTTDGAITEFSAGVADGVITRKFAHPIGITAGPDGNIWFAQNGARAIGRLTPDGVVTSFPTGTARPTSIIAGRDGNLWFNGGGFRQITPDGVITDYPGASPRQLTVGCDGNLWFIAGDSIGRFELSPSTNGRDETLPATCPRRGRNK